MSVYREPSQRDEYVRVCYHPHPPTKPNGCCLDHPPRHGCCKDIPKAEHDEDMRKFWESVEAYYAPSLDVQLQQTIDDTIEPMPIAFLKWLLDR